MQGAIEQKTMSERGRVLGSGRFSPSTARQYLRGVPITAAPLVLDGADGAASKVEARTRL
jgi:hypothetical protein